MANEIATRIAAHKAKLPARKEKADSREAIRKLASQYTDGAIQKLWEVASAKNTPATARVQAINSLIERVAGKASAVERPETEQDEYKRMSQGQLLGEICDSLWGMSSEARAVIAETLVAAEQNIRIDTATMGRDFDEEEAQRVKMEVAQAPKPKREPRR